VTSGTLFHGSHLLLLKWFWALYFIGSDKGSISALRLSKLIEVNWKTARLMLTKLRAAMGHRDSLYRLSGTIERDDAFVGGKHKGKRGRGAQGCKHRSKSAVICRTLDFFNISGYFLIFLNSIRIWL
jgi:hypothetical protein